MQDHPSTFQLAPPRTWGPTTNNLITPSSTYKQIHSAITLILISLSQFSYCVRYLTNSQHEHRRVLRQGKSQPYDILIFILHATLEACVFVGWPSCVHSIHQFINHLVHFGIVILVQKQVVTLRLLICQQMQYSVSQRMDSV